LSGPDEMDQTRNVWSSTGVDGGGGPQKKTPAEKSNGASTRRIEPQKKKDYGRVKNKGTSDEKLYTGKDSWNRVSVLLIRCERTVWYKHGRMGLQIRRTKKNRWGEQKRGTEKKPVIYHHEKGRKRPDLFSTKSTVPPNTTKKGMEKALSRT